MRTEPPRLLRPLFRKHRFFRLGLSCGWRAALAIAWNDRFGRGFYTIRPRGVPHPLRLRARSSDSAVVVQVFDGRELEIATPVPPRVIVDAGANNGISAVFFATAHPGALVLAIEPDPENFALCLENTRPYPSIRCVQAALWHRPGRLVLENPGSGAWARRFGEGSGGTEVEAITVPQAIALTGADRVDLLKMDIEGAERELLRHEHEDGWLARVGTLVLELHEQASPGCEAALDAALARIPSRRVQSGEKVVVFREPA